MTDEGYIKFTLDWTQGPSPEPEAISAMNHCRGILYLAGLIGWDTKDNVGFGNISCRNKKAEGFFISGTQTGGVAETHAEHYTMVTEWLIEDNRVKCIGPVAASSESLTHAAIYECDPQINAVIHIHHEELWNRLKGKYSSTPDEAHYGIPAMAKALATIVQSQPAIPIAVMTGHYGGLISWGSDFDTAFRPLILEAVIKM